MRALLLSPCMACNREARTLACPLCTKIELAERKAGNYPPSPQLQVRK